MATKNSALRDKEATDFAALWDGGVLRIKAGGVTLVDFALDTPAFGAPSAGTIAAESLPLVSVGAATGTADSAELRSAGGTYTITGLSVGVGSGQVQLDNLSIASDQNVTLTAFTFTKTATVS